MAEPHVDQPGDIRWLPGCGPSPVVGGCPHQCPHHLQSVIARGPSAARYVLVACDVPGYCDGGCRAWCDDQGIIRTAWLQVQCAQRLLSEAGRG